MGVSLASHYIHEGEAQVLQGMLVGYPTCKRVVGFVVLLLEERANKMTRALGVGRACSEQAREGLGTIALWPSLEDFVFCHLHRYNGWPWAATHSAST